MNTRKKGMILFTCILLLTAMLGMTSFAAASQKTAAAIGSKQYTSLDAAVKAVKKGQTIKVTKNITTSDTLAINKSKVSFTIDFGKKTYKYTGKDYAIRLNKGNVTIKNAKMTVSTGKALYVKSGASATVSSGTFTGNGNSSTWDKIMDRGLFYNCGTLTVKGGTIKAGKNAAVHNKGTLKVTGGTFSSSLPLKDNSYPVDSGALLLNYKEKGKITVSGGTFTANVNVFFNGGSLTIKGGTFTSAKGSALWNTHAAVTISGGTFVSKGDWATVLNTSDDLGKGKITIKKGTFTAANMVLESWGSSTMTINGGTFKTTSTYDPGGKRPVMLAFNTSRITVNGGTFTGKKTYLYYQDKKASVKLNGGKFNTKYKRKSTV